MEKTENPFGITKSVDFSDTEINDYWVDLQNSSFYNIIKPISPMPMILLGGKGSGKTHIVRHFSFSTQLLRIKKNSKSITSGITEDKYIGIYYSLGGLNEGRFSGKGINLDIWEVVSTYYMDLSIAQKTMETIIQIKDLTDIFDGKEECVCSEILDLFNKPINGLELTFNSLNNYLKELRKEIDFKVNNCVFINKLEVNILTTRGSLIFEIPRIIVKSVKELFEIKFLYIFDELENASIELQKYIQTLIRERKDPCAIKLSGRLYSIKTYETFCSGEENKEGSEFELVEIDQILRKNTDYDKFSENICKKRLEKFDLVSNDISKSFENYTIDEDRLKKLNFGIDFIDLSSKTERKYVLKLKKQLLKFKKFNGEQISEICDNLECNDYPLIEKAAIYLFYQSWYKNRKLIEESKLIKNEVNTFLGEDYKNSGINKIFEHYKSDFYAQLLFEYNQKQRYLGFETFVKLSGGLPRNLLQILKHTYSHSLYLGEKPFNGNVLSIKSQLYGVKKASDWFFEDANIIGIDKNKVKNSINRLASFFREVRYSDKPSECSLIGFSFDETSISEEAKRIIRLAQQWSLLLSINSGRRDKNSKRVDESYQLNTMLSPHWDLPFSSRGTIPLSNEFVNSIFDENHSKDYQMLLNERILTMNAPFKQVYTSQQELFDEGL